jgi:hypothetical protein
VPQLFEQTHHDSSYSIQFNTHSEKTHFPFGRINFPSAEKNSFPSGLEINIVQIFSSPTLSLSFSDGEKSMQYQHEWSQRAFVLFFTCFVVAQRRLGCDGNFPWTNLKRYRVKTSRPLKFPPLRITRKPPEVIH